MASESLVLDPTSEDAGNTQVSLEDTANGIAVVSQEYPPPERERQFATSADTFGDPYVQGRYRNRVITIRVRCFGTESVMRARVADLTKKVGKLAQYGGTLKRTLNNADVVIFDLLDADIDVPANWEFLHKNSVEVTLTLLAKPAGRGSEVSFDAVSETTLPALIFTVTGVKGDLPGLGRLVITEQDAEDQQFVQAGWECRHYPGASAGTTTAALFYEAETRLPLNGATALALAGASGGTVINQGTLTTSYASMLSLASSGTVYPTHVGDFNVWARVYQGTANAGTVSVAMEWAAGDFLNVTRNTEQELDPAYEGAFLHVPLGQVHLSEVTAGAQRWEGRIIAKSTTIGDDVAVDSVYLFPVTEGYFEARGVLQVPAPTSFVARDEFSQTVGALTGKTLPTGGTWSGAGDASDFNVTGSGGLNRDDVSDTDARFAYAPTSMTSTVVECTFNVDLSTITEDGAILSGVLARYTDTSNYVAAYLSTNYTVTAPDQVNGFVYVTMEVAGTWTVLNSASLLLPVLDQVEMGVDYKIRLVVGASGFWAVWFGRADSVSLSLVATGQNSALATGGALASGKVGVYDNNAQAQACERNFDNFAAWEFVPDAAMFASQSLEAAHNRAEREDSAGTVYGKVRDFRGSYVRVPAENVGGTVRYVVKGSRGRPGGGADAGIDDLGAQLHYTPLYLNVPE